MTNAIKLVIVIVLLWFADAAIAESNSIALLIVAAVAAIEAHVLFVTTLLTLIRELRQAARKAA